MIKNKFGRILQTSSIGVKFGGGKNTFNYSLSKKLNEKNIYTKIDLLLRLPIGTIDRRFCPTLDQLEIGKISTIFVRPIKYNFPRIRNLPFRVTCEDNFGKIDIFFLIHLF